MTRRDAWRALAVTAATPVLLLLFSPAAGAVTRDDGDDPGTSMSTLGWVGLYVLLPLALFALIALAVYAPSLARGSRSRSSAGGSAGPTWFGEPGRSVDAGSAGATGLGMAGHSTPDGGVHGQAGGSRGATVLGADPGAARAASGGGGASARW